MSYLSFTLLIQLTANTVTDRFVHDVYCALEYCIYRAVIGET
jgi:hypothetical protein